jgi:class 3 adenylate cyclase/TolB-like protein/tetratricopeptide (TPR) repeat protein
MKTSATEHRKLAAIMFTDMVGYSALAQRNEALALELLEEHRRVVRDFLPRHGGREVKTTGDGFLIEFSSALAAVQCAVTVQEALHRRNQDQPVERQVRIRIGIHVGDVVLRDGDIHGDGVNIAARIEPLAEPGGICVSEDVARQVGNKLEQPLAVLGAAELKHIALPVVVQRVVLPWEAPGSSRGEPAHSERGKKSPSRLTSAAAKFGWIAALLLLAVGLGGWFIHQSGKATKARANLAGASPLPAANQKSIAVLPFVNLSADKADEYLSDGMTEELLNVLAQVPGLRVPGRSSCFAFKGKSEEGIFRKVGEQLHVTAVLEGSVRKAGDKLRITAQLINVADGFHLWSTNYDREMKDILAVQTEVAQQVVRALQVKLGVEATRALAKTPTENPEAHRLYLLGRYHFGKVTEASLTNAMQYFTQALQQDPSYALAYCGLSDCYGWIGWFGLMSGKEAWAKEKELAQTALALEPNLADAHLSLGIALAGAFDWKGGEQEMKRALQLNPKLALAYDQLAWLQGVFSQFEESIMNSQRAIELDPLSLMFNANLGWRLFTVRRYEEATAQLRKTLVLDPNFADAHAGLGWCSVYKGDAPGGIIAFEKAKSLDPQPYYDCALAYAYARAGDRAKAEQVVREWEDRAKQRYITPALRMLFHLGLGERDKALDWLERCYQDQNGYCAGLRAMPMFDPLRPEPRFQALLKKVGLDK